MTYFMARAAMLILPLIAGNGALAAAETKAGAAVETKAAASAKPSGHQASAKPATEAKQKLVDINSATKQELMTLPYIDEATAEKIVAGRPYTSKADLVTRKFIGLGPYQVIAKRIIAIQHSSTKKK